MQKKIIALAIAAAISAPAFADTSNVTVYGQANMSYDMVKAGSGTTTAGGPTAASSQSVNRTSSNTSRLGLKGSEDLGDGLSAIWQIEMQIDPGQGTTPAANSANVLGGRNTFAGLSSATAGTALMGRHDTPYKIATRAADVFGDGIADIRSLMGGVAGKSAAAAFDGRQDQVVAYISPKLGGIATLAIGYVNLSPTVVTAGTATNSATSLAGMFDIGSGFGGSLAYETHDFGAGTNPVAAAGKEKATKLGLSYAQDAIAANFVYEKTSDNLTAVTGANLYGHNAYYLSGKYSVTASDAVKVSYAKMGNVGTLAAGAANNGAKQFTLGYDHAMSKRTTLYALYSKLTNDAGANYTLSTNGTSGATSGTAGLFGNSPSVFSLGMRHTF
jgi:predicted porin